MLNQPAPQPQDTVTVPMGPHGLNPAPCALGEWPAHSASCLQNDPGEQANNSRQNQQQLLAQQTCPPQKDMQRGVTTTASVPWARGPLRRGRPSHLRPQIVPPISGTTVPSCPWPVFRRGWEWRAPGPSFSPPSLWPPVLERPAPCQWGAGWAQQLGPRVPRCPGACMTESCNQVV